jgi:hypothetical protein
LAVAGLEKSLEGHPEWRGRVRSQRLDVYLRSDSLPDMAGKGLIVDPPRSGLREMLARLKNLNDRSRPRGLIYVSCHEPTLISDSQILQELGFGLKQLIGVDQFPHTSHTEWIASFQCK